MKNKNAGFFWPSYADLMTSLFFIMLVLFVLTIALLKKEQSHLIVKAEQLERIKKIDDQINSLKDNEVFEYLPTCKKYIVKSLKGIEIFEPNKSIIKKKYIPKTVEAGKAVEDFLKKLNLDSNNSFLLVIEGNMANTYDKSISKESKYGYQKSYERALAVYNLWQSNGINLRKYNAEIIISGSGFNGNCRDEVEENNKRFSIQIIPKINIK